jgi:beta-lactamase class A/LysM repeat protein
LPRQIVRLALAVLILAGLFGGRSLVANVADGTQHVVTPGETLSGIAARYGVTVDQLVGLNGIADPDRLVGGQTLKLPAQSSRATGGSPSPTGVGSGQAGGPATTGPASQGQQGAPANAQAPARATEYVVQAGDTLSGIGKALGVSMRALLDANEIGDPDRLRAGQKLTVPAGVPPPAPGVPTGRSNQPGALAAGGPASGPQEDAGALVDRLARQYGVDPALARALAWIETDGRPRRLDAADDLGYLSVTDKTFEFVQQSLVKHALDRADPSDNLEAGIVYVASMLKWGGDDSKGLAGFLQGPGSVRANGVRPAVEEEVKRILALRDRLKQGLPAATTVGAGAGPGQSAAAVAIQPKLASGQQPTSLEARALNAARAVAGPDARIGISGRNLVSGQRLAVAAEQSFPAASVGKLALLIEAYRQSFGGTLSLSEAQRSDLRAMIVASDNDAANRLLELLGTRAVNAQLQALGLLGTRLGNPFGLAHFAGSPANVTTPSDMTRLMEKLATEQLVGTQASREMRGLLLQSQDGSKLKRGLPADARIAHKSGWYDGVANDVGIISHGQSSYILGVFTQGIPDAETANQTIAAVAQVVHGAWGPGLPGAAAASRTVR